MSTNETKRDPSPIDPKKWRAWNVIDDKWHEVAAPDGSHWRDKWRFDEEWSRVSDDITNAMIELVDPAKLDTIEQFLASPQGKEWSKGQDTPAATTDPRNELCKCGHPAYSHWGDDGYCTHNDIGDPTDTSRNCRCQEFVSAAAKDSASAVEAHPSTPADLEEVANEIEPFICSMDGPSDEMLTKWKTTIRRYIPRPLSGKAREKFGFLYAEWEKTTRNHDSGMVTFHGGSRSWTIEEFDLALTDLRNALASEPDQGEEVAKLKAEISSMTEKHKATETAYAELERKLADRTRQEHD